MTNDLNYRDRTKDDIIKELQKLQQEFDSLKTLYEKDITNYKQAEKEIRSSEERWRKLVTTSPDFIAVHDINGNFLFLNRYIKGYSEKDVIGKSFMNIVSDESKNLFRSTFDKCQKTKKIQKFEYIASGGNGKPCVYEGYFVPIIENMRVVSIMSVAKDITDRKQMEVRLLLEKENFRHSLDDSPLGVRIASEGGNTIYANKTFLDIYGYDSFEELQKKPLKDRFTSESYKQAQKRKSQRKRGDLSATGYQISIIRKDGGIRHLQVWRKEILWDGIRRFQIINIDVTGRKETEEALKQSEKRYRVMGLALQKSEERFRNITEQVTDVIFMTDTKGLITYISPSARSVFGYSQEEMISLPFIEFLEKKSIPKAMKSFNFSLIDTPIISDRRQENLTLLMKHKDGSVFTGELTSNPFCENEIVTGTIGVIRNISQRLQAEEEIRKSKELMEDLNQRLVEIRENERAHISREIHDQIGQTLTALKLDLNWMKGNISDSPKTATKISSMIELISDSIKDVQRISSDLRPGILDDLGLASAIEWYIDEFKNRTGIRCILKLRDSVPEDPPKNLVFFRVLQEALTNVIRHANASSVTIRLHHNQQGISLTIQDNGTGIPKEKIESSRSLGLIGMSERVRQVGGKVIISAEKGKGTKLTVTIP